VAISPLKMATKSIAGGAVKVKASYFCVTAVQSHFALVVSKEILVMMKCSEY
jgi:hypothetical protein